MRTISLDSPKFLGSNTIPTRLDKLARRLVLSRLEKLKEGRIVISEYDRQYRYGVLTDACPLAAHVVVHHPKFYSDIAFGGTVGSGEAYIHGHWSCDDLTALIRILLMNRHVIEEVDSGAAVLTRPMRKLFHWLNRNTRQGSQRNIAAHYDLGNDFYRLWLDKQMMYSCAYFESSDATLDEAAVAKLDRACRKLDLSANDSVLEIGSGWGGFAIHAAKNYGCHVTTTTISKSQHEFARRRIAEEGLEDRITLLDKDYRDLEGRFDKLVSIEMIEAVGHEFHSMFFQKCCELLKPDGQMLLQAITIADQRYEAAKNSVDFIKRYIFPGGSLTSVTDMAQTLTSATDMRVIHLEDIGPHYALTLRRWHERFLERLDEIRQLEYSEEFVRMWQFYLSYCESAFIERATGTVQMLLMRPLARRESVTY
jgi:cyclopropane-fatty-acyl-phospholipid synthase